jgi:hypothetical protein
MAEEHDDRWIEHANIKHGAFGAKAKKAGMSTGAYAKKEEHAKGKLGREARLAETFSKLRKRK